MDSWWDFEKSGHTFIILEIFLFYSLLPFIFSLHSFWNTLELEIWPSTIVFHFAFLFFLSAFSPSLGHSLNIIMLEAFMKWLLSHNLEWDIKKLIKSVFMCVKACWMVDFFLISNCLCLYFLLQLLFIAFACLDIFRTVNLFRNEFSYLLPGAIPGAFIFVTNQRKDGNHNV